MQTFISEDFLFVLKMFDHMIHACIFVQPESPIHNGGTRHASLSEEEENLAVLRRYVIEIESRDISVSFSLLFCGHC